MTGNKKDEVPEAVKINKWDGAAAKHALDDAIREVLTGDLKCKECFTLIDTRLFLSTLAVGIALYALLWDYLYPFPQSKIVLIICVTSYFILMGILTLHTTYVEKGIFVVVKEKKGNKTRAWEASSFVKKHDDKYQFELVLYDFDGKRKITSFTHSFADYIDTNGLVEKNLVSKVVTSSFEFLSSDVAQKKGM